MSPGQLEIKVRPDKWHTEAAGELYKIFWKAGADVSRTVVPHLALYLAASDPHASWRRRK